MRTSAENPNRNLNDHSLLLIFIDYIVNDVGTPQICEIQRVVNVDEEKPVKADGRLIMDPISVAGFSSYWDEHAAVDNMQTLWTRLNLDHNASYRVRNDPLLEHKGMQRRFLMDFFPAHTPAAVIINPSDWDQEDLRPLWNLSEDKVFFMKEPRGALGDNNYILNMDEMTFENFVTKAEEILRDETVLVNEGFMMGIPIRREVPLGDSKEIVFEHCISNPKHITYRCAVAVSGDQVTVVPVTTWKHSGSLSSHDEPRRFVDFIQEYEFNAREGTFTPLTQEEKNDPHEDHQNAYEYFRIIAQHIYERNQNERELCAPGRLMKSGDLPGRLEEGARGYEILSSICMCVHRWQDPDKQLGFMSPRASNNCNQIRSGLPLQYDHPYRGPNNIDQIQAGLNLIFDAKSEGENRPTINLSRNDRVIKKTLLEFEHGVDNEQTIRNTLPLSINEINCPKIYANILLRRVIRLYRETLPDDDKKTINLQAYARVLEPKNITSREAAYDTILYVLVLEKLRELNIQNDAATQIMSDVDRIIEKKPSYLLGAVDMPPNAGDGEHGLRDEGKSL